MATLIIVDGPASGQQFALADHRICMIGRDDQCTFQVLDPQMSRRHFQVKQAPIGGGHLIVDAGSSNGVELNGDRVGEEALLTNGDLIHAGQSTILYVSTDSPDAKQIDELMRSPGEHRKTTIVGGRPDGA